MIKRNQVVYDKTEKAPWYIYGRVVRMLEKDEVLWITCKGEIHISPIENIEVVSYNGRWETYFIGGKHIERWLNMPTLRQLKQRATRYYGRHAWNTPVDHDGIWRH